MDSTAFEYHLRRRRGVWTIDVKGRTPKGRKYIVTQQVIAGEKPSDPEFKTSIGLAIRTILDNVSPSPK